MSSASLTLLIVSGVLVGSGVYLILERTLTRVVIGLSMVTHGVNLLLLSSGGAAGRPPLLGSEDPAAMADPLPQAMILTAIVLSLGTSSFGLALAYRSWRLTGHDEVVDDIEDRAVARHAEAAAVADTEASTGDEDAGINYDSDDGPDPGPSAPPPAPTASPRPGDPSTDRRADRHRPRQERP